MTPEQITEATLNFIEYLDDNDAGEHWGTDRVVFEVIIREFSEFLLAAHAKEERRRQYELLKKEFEA